MLFSGLIIEYAEFLEWEDRRILAAHSASILANDHRGKAAKTDAAKDAHGKAAGLWHNLRDHKLIGATAIKLRDHHQALSRGRKSENPVQGMTRSKVHPAVAKRADASASSS
jgi:hypothetical protein